MMFKLRNKIDEVCVLSISPAVLDLPGVVISDSNASSNYVRFAAAPNGLQIVDRSLTFADDWRDDDQIQYYRKKAAKCAEVLVPDCVAPEYLLRIYVAHEQTGQLLNAVVTELVATVDANMFFVRGD